MTDLAGELARTAWQLAPWVAGVTLMGVGGWLVWSAASDVIQAERDRAAAEAAEAAAEVARATAAADSTVPDGLFAALDQVRLLVEQGENLSHLPAWASAWGTVLWVIGMNPARGAGLEWSTILVGATQLANLLGDLSRLAPGEGSFLGPAFELARDDVLLRVAAVSEWLATTVPPSLPTGGGGAGWGSLAWMFLGSLAFQAGVDLEGWVRRRWHRTRASNPVEPLPDPVEPLPDPVEPFLAVARAVEDAAVGGGWLALAAAAAAVVLGVYLWRRRRGRGC